MTRLTPDQENHLRDLANHNPAVRNAIRALDRVNPCNETVYERAIDRLESAYDVAVRAAANTMGIRLTEAQSNRIEHGLVDMVTEDRMPALCPAPRR